MNKLAWEKLIVALDVSSEKKLKKIVTILTPRVKKFKIGLIGYTRFGPRIISWIKKQGGEVFLDLKLFDIPHTMTETAKVMADMGVWGLTVHAKAGRPTLRTLNEQLRQYTRSKQIKKPLIIAVTELTSQSASLKKVRIGAKVAAESGLEAVVCSVREARQIKGEFGLITVCPGIRNAQKDDQKRTATVSEAIQAQADFIVVGRPIIQHKDPLTAAQNILAT